MGLDCNPSTTGNEIRCTTSKELRYNLKQSMAQNIMWLKRLCQVYLAYQKAELDRTHWCTTVVSLFWFQYNGIRQMMLLPPFHTMLQHIHYRNITKYSFITNKIITINGLLQHPLLTKSQILSVCFYNKITHVHTIYLGKRSLKSTVKRRN